MTLMTSIFLAPVSLITTSNSVFSSTGSAAAAAGPEAAATATGAAAETPHFSSSFLTNSAASRTDRVESSSTSLSSFSDIFVLLTYEIIFDINCVTVCRLRCNRCLLCEGLDNGRQPAGGFGNRTSKFASRSLQNTQQLCADHR